MSFSSGASGHLILCCKSKCSVNVADQLRRVSSAFIYYLRYPNTDFISVLAIFLPDTETIGFREPESLWLGLQVRPAVSKTYRYQG